MVVHGYNVFRIPQDVPYIMDMAYGDRGGFVRFVQQKLEVVLDLTYTVRANVGDGVSGKATACGGRRIE